MFQIKFISNFAVMVILFVLYMSGIVMPVSYAAVQPFSAKGEYTMSDYETPEIAEERAFAYAKRYAAEQAGVYIESYTRSINAQVDADQVHMISGTLLNVLAKNTRKETTPNGDIHIIVELTANIDTDLIDDTIRQKSEIQQATIMAYTELQIETQRLEQENAILKQKIADTKIGNQSITELVQESKAKEREYASNLKILDSYSFSINKHYDEAISFCEEAIRLNPKNPMAYSRLGSVYIKKRRYDYAIMNCEKAIMLDSHCVIAYIDRGYAYYLKGDFNQAIIDYTTALSINAGKVREELIYVMRGVAFDAVGQYEQALSDFDVAVKLNPKFGSAYSGRGLVYSHKKEFDQAIADYNKAIAINPNFAEAYYNRGIYYHIIKGFYELALADYTMALVIDPNYVEAHNVYNNRGAIYEWKGNYDLAMADYDMAITIKPDFALAYYNRGNIYLKKENDDKAIIEYTKSLTLNPNYADAYFNRGLSYYYKAQDDLAINDLQQALKLDPTNEQYAKVLQEVLKSKEANK